MKKPIIKHIEDFKKVHADKYSYEYLSDEMYLNTKQLLPILCKNCSKIFYQNANNHKSGKGCPVCKIPKLKKPRKRVSEHIEDFKKVHLDKYDYSLINEKNYKSTDIKVPIICKRCNEVFYQKPNAHKRGNGCPKCKIKKTRKSVSEHIEDFKKVHLDKYDYSLINEKNYKSTVYKLPIICKRCNEVFYQKPNAHKMGHGCKKCSILNQKKSKSYYIKKFLKIHGDKYNYNLFKNYSFARDKIKIICNNCNCVFETSVLNHVSGVGCPKCNSSKGEFKIQQYLKENNIKYLKEYVFKECCNIKPLRFDFYLPDKNILIEYDGEQHFKPVEYFGGEEAFKRIQKTDKIKTDFAKIKNIPLIRIKYKDFDKIEKILGDIK